MNTHWIVVADASRARVLSADDAGSLELIHALSFPLARKRSQELVSDEAGRIDKGGRGILSAMDPRTDPHAHQAELFARELSELLDKAAGRNAYGRLTIVAPAHFLGLLRESISSQTRRKLVGDLARDLTPLELPQLAEHLRRISQSKVEPASQ